MDHCIYLRTEFINIFIAACERILQIRAELGLLHHYSYAVLFNFLSPTQPLFEGDAYSGVMVKQVNMACYGLGQDPLNCAVLLFI